MKGTLKNGFKFEVRGDIEDDYEFIELYRKAQDDPLFYVDLLNMMLGEEQMDRLKDSLRDKKGVVHVTKGDYTITDAISEIMDIIQQSGTAGKN